MITKGTPQYTEAQKMANQLTRMAGYDRLYQNSLYEISFNTMGIFLEKIKKLNVFASQIAETVYKTMMVYGRCICKMSDKQAWSLACAAVENNIEL